MINFHDGLPDPTILFSFRPISINDIKISIYHQVFLLQVKLAFHLHRMGTHTDHIYQIPSLVVSIISQSALIDILFKKTFRRDSKSVLLFLFLRLVISKSFSNSSHSTSADLNPLMIFFFFDSKSTNSF